MAVKKGYKQTEIGIIPEEWEVRSVGEMTLKFLNGGTPPTNIPIYWNGNIPWITGADFENHNINNIRRFITKEAVTNSSTNVVLKGNLLIVTRTGVGKMAIATFDIAISQDITGVILKENINPLYIYHYLSHNSSLLTSLIQGTSIAGITREVFEKIQIFIPADKSEQSAIAAVLSDIDEYILSLERLIAKKKAIKQGAMQNLLTGKIRLNGFEGEWVEKKLGEISDICTGKKNNEDKVQNGKYPFFVRSQQVERINSYAFDGEAIIVPGEGNIGEIFHYINGKFDWHQRVYKISDFDVNCFGKYLYYYVKVFFGKYALMNTVKATVDSLRLPTFQHFEIKYPPTLAEQTAIATILSDMDTEIEALQAKLNKAKQVKQGAMQQLLTGKIRLNLDLLD